MCSLTTTLEYSAKTFEAGAVAALLDESAVDEGSILVTTFECNGEQVTVTTTQNPGESNEDFAARHKDRVQQEKDARGC